MNSLLKHCQNESYECMLPSNMLTLFLCFANDLKIPDKILKTERGNFKHLGFSLCFFKTSFLSASIIS